MLKQNLNLTILVSLFILVTGVMAFFYWQGTSSSIDWKITTHAEPVSFAAHQFQKGPFQFSLPGDYFVLTESFSAGPIDRYFNRDRIFLAITWLGICLILTSATYLSRIWFLGVAGLFIFMIINLKLPLVGVFGFPKSSNWGNILLILLFIAPAYVFHAFLTRTHFLLRTLALVGSSLVVVFLGVVDIPAFQDQMTVGVYNSMVVLMLIFLFLISEENIFGILYLITKSKGGSNNQKHFSVFSLIYLVFLGMVYGKKAGWLKMELPFFDPYVLLVISALVALWSFAHKKDLYQNLLSPNHAKCLLAGIGIAVFGFLTLSFSRGNDALYEGFHYFIIYAHLGFGAFFFFYTIVNFVDPLANGLQVHKVVYKPQGFPYITARLGGIVAVIAFFLLSDKVAFNLFKAGQYNYLGEQAELAGEKPLADEYYKESNIYGHDNHFANYKIAYHNLQKNKIEEANHKFGRATLRYPSPHSFVNQSSTYSMLNEVTPSLVALETGLKRFPNSNAILNNLGLIYTDLGRYEKASFYFAQADEAGQWNHANQVNMWKIGQGEDASRSFSEGNLAVKTNVLANLLASGQTAEVEFDPSQLKTAYPLHKSAYLINGAWYFSDEQANAYLNETLQHPQDEKAYQVGMEALALASYKVGDVDIAIKKLDQLYHQANPQSQARHLNSLGLICLEQHALTLAHDFFVRAIEHGSSEAPVNKAVTLLEMGRFDEAISWLQLLGNQDSSFQRLAEDFTIILNGSNLKEDQKLAHLYYKYWTISPTEMKSRIQNLNPAFIRTLWEKLSSQLLEARDYDLLNDYFIAFQPHLKRSDYEEYLAIRALDENKPLEGDHPIAQALQAPDSIGTQMLYAEASRNSLNVPLVLAVAQELTSDHTQKAYDILVHAIDINPESTPLLKAYVGATLDLRLYDYASPVLERLSRLMQPESFKDFLDSYEAKKAKLQESDQSW